MPERGKRGADIMSRPSVSSLTSLASLSSPPIARRNRKRLTPLTLAIALAGASAAACLTGCPMPESKTGLTYAANAEREYNVALEEFKAHNWLQAQALFREVKRKYSYSRYAPLAE